MAKTRVEEKRVTVRKALNAAKKANPSHATQGYQSQTTQITNWRRGGGAGEAANASYFRGQEDQRQIGE
ncbi:hypothetical protein EG328_003143 [Venturia inaequalis]|uniref:Uncharacterized protein n=1 Tax=Venturia inaequalis TaxID=5025 RepID=A0A8H3UVE0_VENIN|nr:hypothetical protein EG328_003143 [Venturia inaequalis]